MWIPAGYTYVERPRKRLVASGFVVFGTLYTISVMGGIGSVVDGDSSYLPMVIPLLGPFFATQNIQGISGIGRFFLWTDAIGQITGAALATLGFVWDEKLLLRDEKGPKISLVPELVLGPGALGMRLRF